MEARAHQIGYRLEPVWLRAPGMTRRRFGGILDTRGIQGLLCFGSPRLDDEFPEELDHYAIVTVGLSIRTPLHRVTSHFYNDTITALDRLRSLGYQRPGLVIGRYEDIRTSHIHVAAYLGWCDRNLGPGRALPVLDVEKVEEDRLMTWLRNVKPDALVFVHLYDRAADLRKVLDRNMVRVPGDVGVAVLSHFLEGTGLSGMQQNQRLMGAWSVELLAARIANNDVGFPAAPRIEMVESTWVDGGTLRRA
jgi:DNA-binding LacI/PurR family transcriptional regulator